MFLSNFISINRFYPCRLHRLNYFHKIISVCGSYPYKGKKKTSFKITRYGFRTYNLRHLRTNVGGDGNLVNHNLANGGANTLEP